MKTAAVLLYGAIGIREGGSAFVYSPEVRQLFFFVTQRIISSMKMSVFLPALTFL